MALHELKDAAAMLGLSPEELVEMRGRNEIFGMRDGKSWKFKTEEIERILALREHEAEAKGGSGIHLDETLAAGEGSGLDADLDELIRVDDLKLEDASSVFDAEIAADATSSSTVIGHRTGPPSDLLAEVTRSPAAAPDETSARLAGTDPFDDMEFDLGPELGSSSDSDPSLTNGPPTPSETTAADPLLADPAPGESAIFLEGGDAGPTSGSTGSGLNLSGDSSVRDDDRRPASTAPAPDETGAIARSTPSSDDDIILDSSADFEISDEDLGLSPSGSSSELKLAATDSQLRLDDKVDLDAAASDISLDAERSGINLESPSDSGISLEQTPPEILVGGDSLELGEADLLDLDDGLADLSDSTALQGDDEFLLTPVEPDAMEESDSGSQVIALDSEEFEESGSTILTGDSGILSDGSSPELGQPGGAAAEETPFGAGLPGMSIAPEAPYTIWNVMGLGAISVVLGLAGIMVFDVVRHIWSWDQPYSLNSTLMDALTSVFGN